MGRNALFRVIMSSLLIYCNRIQKSRSIATYYYNDTELVFTLKKVGNSLVVTEQET